MVALFVLLIALILGGICSAQNVAPEPLPALLQPAEYAAPVVEAQEVPFQEMPYPEMEVGCGDECVDCGPMCVQPSYWYGGLDLLFTVFSYQNSIFYHDDAGAVAIRPYLGWESPSGVGIRGRFWFFNMDQEVRFLSDPHLQSALETSAVNIDFDFYRRFHYDRTSFLLGAGTKAANLRFDYDSLGRSRYSGGGISVFAEGYHPLYRGRVIDCAFIGYSRFGLLTGRIERRDWQPPWDEADTNMSITEMGLGLELKRKLHHSDLVFQIVSEIQRWETNMTSDLAFDSVGLRFGGQW